ncbi:hypothetical protein G6M89_19440 [Natronolimnobius sp. AArcel1]|uniref:hypothetical protein n=1 Tax=Natronolimnobius sp. AArcel1 TaxID=1679093 RepID=UPI0013EE39A8|nr:hypothetical protein [Natronolimnobius sp. AArcel1]NGM71150.1 hypothetical protein [Natronolimnobius sp. AArcel1]
MRRRALLATLGSTMLAGCTVSGPAVCARPSFSADRLEFESRSFSTVGGWWSQPGAILATEPAHLERFEPPERIIEERGLDPDRPADEQAFLEETDFDESIIVGLVVGSSGQSTEAAVTHTVAAEAAVQCYVCIRRQGLTDDLAPQARLVRIDRASGWTPEEVHVTLTDGRDSTETTTSNGTRSAIAGDHEA